MDNRCTNCKHFKESKRTSVYKVCDYRPPLPKAFLSGWTAGNSLWIHPSDPLIDCPTFEPLEAVEAGRERGEEGAGGLPLACDGSPMDLAWVLRSLEPLVRPLENETGIARLEGLRGFVLNLKAKLQGSASAEPQRAFGQIRETDAGLPLWATGQFTQEVVFYNMLIAWRPDQCKKFYAMLSRRPDFNPEAGMPGEGYRLLVVGEIVEAGDEVWAYGNGPWGPVNDWTVGKAVIRGYNPMRRALLGEGPADLRGGGTTPSGDKPQRGF